MRAKLLQISVLGVAFGAISCSGMEDPTPVVPSEGGAAGAQSSGGNGPVQTTGSGGNSKSASGGSNGDSDGGTSATSNTDNSERGGAGTSTGGTRATGGTSSRTTATGGRATGGNQATGGRATGGNQATGGRATGGNQATGGASTSSTSATSCGNITSSCSEANKTLSGNGTGKHCNYTYEYWKDSGSGNLVLKPDGFSVNWSGINNLLGRKGIRPGSKNLKVTFDANYNPNGNSYLCVYGWTRNPLIEYYIVDSWGSWKPPGGSSIGKVTCDGGSYDIFKTQRVNQPSIDGTQTFYQFWSVRSEKRTCGTITVGCHFDAWASNGLSLGSFYEVSMTVEGYQSSGSADVKMSIQ